MPRNLSRGHLPYAPLTLSDITRVQFAEVPGAPALAELDGVDALEAWNVARALLLFVQYQELPFSPISLEHWESTLLRSSEQNPFLSSLAVIVGELRAWPPADRSLLCTACLSVADELLQRGAVGSALLFMELAALAWPDNGRFAMAAGRAFKSHGRLREADRWLRRAVTLSRWAKDWETHALSTSSFGMLCWTQGNSPRARKRLLRALHLARRYHLPVIEGEVLHNLLVVAITTEDHQRVTEYARGALERYIPDHPRLAALAYDVAYYWMTRGQPHKALPMFCSLLPHFENPTQQLQVLSATARAAGACGDKELFEHCWSVAFALAERAKIGVTLPNAMIDLGFAAAHFAEWERSSAAFTAALYGAQKFGMSEELIRAETCAAAVHVHRNPDTLALPAGADREVTDPMTLRFVGALRNLPVQRQGEPAGRA